MCPRTCICSVRPSPTDRKSTRLNSSHLGICPLPLNDALPICLGGRPELCMSFHAAMSGFAPDVPKDLYLLGQTFADPVRTAAGVLPLVDAAIRSEERRVRKE